jgi:predicted aspartyl protease
MSSGLFTYDYSTDYDPPMPVVEIGLSLVRNSQPDLLITALIDSGADATLIPVDVRKAIGARPVSSGYLRGILGGREPVKIYLVALYIGSHVLNGIRVVAVPQGDESILGRNALNQLVVTLNGLASVTEIPA